MLRLMQEPVLEYPANPTQDREGEVGMAKYKRYFPVSHEINHDPEVLELVKKFGAPGLQLWLEVLSITDKTENVLKVSDYWLEKVSKLVGCRFATGLLALNHAVAKGWLTPNKPFERGLEVTYSLPNYAEYHRTRSVNSHKLDSHPKQIGVPPSFLPNLPKLPKENPLKKEDERKDAEASRTTKKKIVLAEKPDGVNQEVWDGFIAVRNKKGFPFTVTALKSTIRESEKAGYTLEQALETCQRRGWRGFEARYIEKDTAEPKNGFVSKGDKALDSGRKVLARLKEMEDSHGTIDHSQRSQLAG